jgi:hypothetical protein
MYILRKLLLSLGYYLLKRTKKRVKITTNNMR